MRRWSCSSQPGPDSGSVPRARRASAWSALARALTRTAAVRRMARHADGRCVARAERRRPGPRRLGPAGLAVAALLIGFPAGAAWFAQSSGTSADLHDVTVNHGNHDIAWACGAGGVIVGTTNGGATWTPLPSGTDRDLYGIAFLELEGGPVVAVGAEGTILITFDEGVSWQPRPSGTVETLREISDFGELIVGDRGTILHSPDFGLTWVPQASPDTARLNGIAGGFGRMAVGDDGTILTANGSSGPWVRKESGVTVDLHAVPMFAARDFCVGDGGTILRSDDFGTTWIPASSGTTQNLRGVEYSVNNDSRIYVVGDGGTILRSTDGGDSWFQQGTGTFADLHSTFFYLNDLVGYAVGAGGTILKTTDGGGGTAGAELEPGGPPRPGSGPGLSLELVYPNPPAGLTTVRFRTSRPGLVEGRLYDAAGRAGAVLFRRELGPGEHEVPFAWPELPAGVRWLRLEEGAASAATRIVTGP